jgi:hypothetical protein
MRNCAAAFGLACLALCVTRTGHAQITPLFVIPTESTGVAVAAGAPVRVVLTASDAAKLAAGLGVRALTDATSFEYTVGAYPQIVGPADRTWLEATFVVDFDQPEFALLKTEMAGLGSRPTRAQIVEFVNRTVDEHTPRGWDLASVVAKRRQGDCSEHAVLTTALARMYGIPTRVTVGVALISDGKDFAAYGHAWTDMQENGKWVVADAAMLEMAANVRYIPMSLMEDEGMGYVMSLAGLSNQWIQNVKVLGPAD